MLQLFSVMYISMPLRRLSSAWVDNKTTVVCVCGGERGGGGIRQAQAWRGSDPDPIKRWFLGHGGPITVINDPFLCVFPVQKQHLQHLCYMLSRGAFTSSMAA